MFTLQNCQNNISICSNNLYGSKKIASSVTRFGDFCTLGNFLKPLEAINLPKFPTFLGNFFKGFKIYHFPNEIIFGQLL